MSYGIARQRDSNNELNKVYREDRAVHDWYRFVLSYPPHLVRQYLEKFNVDSQHTVLDPFCGTGTTLVECKKLGIPGVGIEANPVAYLASQVKVDWTVLPDELMAHASTVAAEANATLRREGIEDNPVFLFGQTTSQPLRCLSFEKEKLLLNGSISPLPLHKTLTLLDQLEEKRNERFHQHELLALAKALSSSIGNLYFGPEVGVGPAKADAPVVAAWLDGVRKMAEDLQGVGGASECPSAVYLGDSRAIIDTLQSSSIDAVITSPPYPNEKDYTRTTRLELVMLGFLKNKEDLRALKHDLVRSNTRGVYQDDDDDRWVADHPEIGRIAEEIESRRIELGKTSGFERMYARVTKLYFGGMKRHLASLRRVLRPGANLAYVVGDQASYLRVLIRTGELLAGIAESLGYEVVGIDLFRTRLATATKQQLREEVVLLRWKG